MSDAKIKLIGAVVAVVLHLLLAALFTHDAFIKWLKPDKTAEQVEQKPEKAPQVSFRFNVQPKPEPPKPKPVAPEPPKPAEKRFNSTSSEQAQGKPKDATHYGDRDTVAQSDTEAEQDAPNIPAVKGKKKGGQVLASNYQDGKLDNDRAGGAQQTAQPPAPAVTEIPEPQDQATKQVTEPSDQLTGSDAGRSLAGSNNPLKEYMDAVNKLPSSVRNKKTTKQLPKPDKGEGEDEKEQKKKVVQERPKPRKESKPRTTRIDSLFPNPGEDPGFRAQTNASQISGSISRSGGVASFDTEANALGRYKKQVSNATAKEWYRRIGKNPDLVLPGSLQVRWLVYPNGRAKSVRILNSFQGSEIQTGMTLQSISGAKLPPMPKDLVSELKGDPIEMIITFQF
ncbi:hypothetical protein [Rubritalea marina]|uniref:hypothetical protein n=1 Tax=Rubritalea marina TaxID=361055 RepID=UPI00037FBE9E|nr:hypothetical protein [Rubritalea marina]